MCTPSMLFSCLGSLVSVLYVGTIFWVLRMWRVREEPERELRVWEMGKEMMWEDRQIEVAMRHMYMSGVLMDLVWTIVIVLGISLLIFLLKCALRKGWRRIRNDDVV